MDLVKQISKLSRCFTFPLSQPTLSVSSSQVRQNYGYFHLYGSKESSLCDLVHSIAVQKYARMNFRTKYQKTSPARANSYKWVKNSNNIGSVKIRPAPATPLFPCIWCNQDNFYFCTHGTKDLPRKFAEWEIPYYILQDGLGKAGSNVAVQDNWGAQLQPRVISRGGAFVKTVWIKAGPITVPCLGWLFLINVSSTPQHLRTLKIIGFYAQKAQEKFNNIN